MNRPIDLEHALQTYEDRLRACALDRPNLMDWMIIAKTGGRKFGADGSARPFYGFTCLTRVEPESALFQTLSDLQQTLKHDCETMGVAHLLSFLAPASLHLTICDIDAGEIDELQKLGTRLQQVRDAFTQIGTEEPVTARVRGIGLTSTITALVHFDTIPDLRRVLVMEQHIKTATGINRRDFPGHISLAYMVQPPQAALPDLIKILTPYHRDLGDLIISTVELAAFTDMNTYLPLLTLKLTDGTTIQHEDNQRALLGAL